MVADRPIRRCGFKDEEAVKPEDRSCNAYALVEIITIITELPYPDNPPGRVVYACEAHIYDMMSLGTCTITTL